MHDDVPFVVIALDPDLAVVGWNARAEQIFATPRDAARGRPLAELLPLAGGASWAHALAGDGRRRLVVDHPAGARHLDAWPQRAGDPATLTLFADDVTAGVPAERRQRLESAMYDAMRRNLDVSVWAIDRRGGYLLNEGKATAAAGMQENCLIGRNIFEFVPDNPDNPICRALAGEPGYHPPLATYGVFWETWFVPVDDPGCDAAEIGISFDVTRATRREEELRSKLELIERQQETIRELSTPIIEVWDGVLTLPIVGLVDSVRTAELMESLLQAVTRSRSRYAILDLTGVQVVDTSTASHLIGLIQSIRLLGAEGVLTGIHPNIAQTIVDLGVDLSRVRVFATLRDALKHCIAGMSKRR